MKNHSSFFNDKVISLIRTNIKTNEAAAIMAAKFMGETSFWMKMSYKEIKSLVFSPELKRSWFVLSDGSCPSCRGSVPMYNWIYDPFNEPWKMKCPHCKGLFPKNDFAAYYNSGIDRYGDFKHEIADRSLLINEEGTDFGVDDGNGWYDLEGRRYMFIGAYLSHARWKSQVKDGIHHLAFSYILSGNIEYARRAAVLLDSIARHWPEYDFFTQGIMYEQEYKSNGYVNYWVDSNRETRSFALGYDQIYECMKNDAGFEKVLGKSFSEFCIGVEDRIFRDSLSNIKKIKTNPPETPQTVAILRTVLNDDYNEIMVHINNLISEATSVDGLSGESGLGGYAAIAPRALADLMCLFTNTDEDFIVKMLDRHPQLYKTYRFHIDTWYDAGYYPGVGDSSVFALPSDKYTALFSIYAPLTSTYHRSREWFAMRIADYYNDPDFAKTIYHSHGSVKGCFDNDFYINDPSFFERKLNDIIASTGPDFKQSSINYNSWRISVLHDGFGENKAMLAMPYDSGKNHCHHDALSLHIFAKGHNMSPDFGYPPVNYGGWNTKEAHWYGHPATHNQVVIDGKRHTNLPPGGDGMFYRHPEYGTNLMFSDGSFVKATYNSAPEYNDVMRNERLAAIIKITDEDCYFLDISRTSGGMTHSRFLHGTYSSLKTEGLLTAPAADYYPDETILRNHMTDNSPKPGWSADWAASADDSLTPLSRNLHMKYTGMTDNTSVSTCESWVDITRMVQTSKIRTGSKSLWIPTLYETKKGPNSRFTGILEVYEGSSNLKQITNIPTNSCNDFDAALKVIHNNGTIDYIIANDPKNIFPIQLPEFNTESDALLAVIRFSDDECVNAAVCSGTYITIRNARFTPDATPDFIEFL